MPRNSSGIYSLPAGNPVVTNTLITSTWANNTMNDLGSELTNSLDRSGRGGMLAALKGVDGAVGAPLYSFTSEPTLGFYRSGAGTLNVGVGGSSVGTFTAAGWTGSVSGGVLAAAADAVGAPGHTWVGDLSTGMWRPAASTLAWSTGGAERMRIDSSGNIGMGTSPIGGALLGVNGNILANATGGAVDRNVVATITAIGSLALGVNNSGATNAYGAVTGTNYIGSVVAPLAVTVTGAERMRIDTAGNTGINNASPDRRLNVFNNTTSGVVGRFTSQENTNTADHGALESVTAAATGSAADFGSWGTASTMWALRAYGNVDRTANAFVNNGTSTLLFGVRADGKIQDGAGNELGYKVIPRTTSIATVAGQRGKVAALSAGYTITGADGWVAGDAFAIYNDSAASITITQGASTTLRLGGTTTTGNRTLAPRGWCNVWCNAANEFILTGAGLS